MRRRPRRQAVRIREPGRTRSAMVSRIRTAPSRPRHPIGQSASRIYEVYHKYPLDFLDPTLQGDGRNFRTKPRLHLPASKEHCETSRAMQYFSIQSRAAGAPQARLRRFSLRRWASCKNIRAGPLGGTSGGTPGGYPRRYPRAARRGWFCTKPPAGG